MINPFPTLEPIYLAYFSYGAAFLFLTFSIGTKNMKGSNLRIADGLWLLALFGLCQGVREFIEIYPLLEGDELHVEEIFNIQVISVVLLIASFLFLLQFGLSLTDYDKSRKTKITAAVYAIFGVLFLLLFKFEFSGARMRTTFRVEIAARNILGFAGGLITAFSMIRYSSSLELRNMTRFISRNLYFAGIVFGCFAVVSTTVFADLIRTVGLPKDLFRAGAAVLVAYFIIKALNIFDAETRSKVEKQARELVQVERLVSLGKLGAGIAHEINNPLTNASLGIQILKKKLHNAAMPTVTEQLVAVEKNIDRAAAIAQELLEFSRDRGIEFAMLDLNDVVRNAIGMLNHKLNRIRIELALAPGGPVRGDRGKLEQVFINVLSNAEEAMPRGGRLTIATFRREGTIEATVADSGSGIEPEIISKIFDPFFTTKDIGSGTGLGLYISYGIIQQHHGTIEVSSIPGKGTTVAIRLPAAES